MKLVLLTAASVVLLSAGAAFADPVTIFGYDVSASLQGAIAPSYEGGSRYAVFPSGNMAMTKPGDFDLFFAPDDAASFGLVNTKQFSLGPAASVIENRGNRDELQGMSNIGWALEAGGFVDWWPTKWMRLRVQALKGITAEDGWEVYSGADFVKHFSLWTFSGGPRFRWGDVHYNQTYFGVTPAEATASPYIKTPYNATAGPVNAGLEAATEYKWRPRWRLTLNANYDRMLSQDANSPLVKKIGSADQLSVAGGVRFMLSD